MPAKLTIEQCKEFAISKGGECLSDEYKNINTIMSWKCSKGHKWNTKFHYIKNGNNWCPHCGGSFPLTLKECREFAQNKGGKCLSDEYRNSGTKMMWECGKSHEWKSTFRSIKNNGHWCPKCSKTAKLTIKECKEFVVSKGGECLSNVYKNSKTKMLWKCSEGHEWMATFDNIKNYGNWCPQCSSGRSEQICRKIFEDHYNAKFPTKRPQFLEGLELDGYNEELNIAFEYNGKQHYEYIPHFHRNGEQDFIKQQERDRMKYKLCSEKNIKLILIPYKFDCYNPDKLRIFILDAISAI